MTHTNDAQTVYTCQTRSVCKPRPPAYVQGPASISTIMSDPRPVFKAGLVIKARLLFEEIPYAMIIQTMTPTLNDDNTGCHIFIAAAAYKPRGINVFYT